MTKKRNKFAFSELKTKCSLEFEIFYFEKWNLRQDMKAFRLKGCEREMKALSARPMFRMKSENFQRTGAQKFFSYKRKTFMNQLPNRSCTRRAGDLKRVLSMQFSTFRIHNSFIQNLIWSIGRPILHNVESTS